MTNTTSNSYDPAGNPTALATGAGALPTTPQTSQPNTPSAEPPHRSPTTTRATVSQDPHQASEPPPTPGTRPTSYIYDNAGNPIEHIDANATVHYYQHDQYGSTRLLTDSTGNIAATYTYDPNGNPTQKTGTADTPLRWNGQCQDQDTGLYYLRARYYDPISTQFISVDPLAAATREAYIYAGNDPLNAADPTGLISVGGCANGAIGAIMGVFGEACGILAIDDRNGNITIGTTRTLGGGMQSPTANVNLAYQISSARTVDQLGGTFGYGGISANEVVHGGVTIFGGRCADAPGGVVLGAEYAGGLAAPGIPIEVHMGASYTWTETNFTFNPWEWFH